MAHKAPHWLMHKYGSMQLDGNAGTYLDLYKKELSESVCRFWVITQYYICVHGLLYISNWTVLSGVSVSVSVSHKKNLCPAKIQKRN